MLYAFHENFVLPLSHDEVVHGKGSLLGKMPGDVWQKFANLRLLYRVHVRASRQKNCCSWAVSSGSGRNGTHDSSLEWHLLQYDSHQTTAAVGGRSEPAYRAERALHELDCDPAGFEWIDGSDSQQSMLSFMRKSRGGDEIVVAVFNFTPIARHHYRVGVPRRRLLA